jgi:NitT/TauT family transport system substrate-binding protein
MITRSTVLATLPLLAAATTRATAQPATLRIGVTPSDGFGEALYGADMGFFREAGIEAEVQALPGEGTILPAVIGRSLDVGIATPMTLGNARVKGLAVEYFAAGGIYSSALPTLAFIVAKDNPIRGPKELEGATLGINGLRDGIHLAVVAWLARAGVDVAQVKFVEVGRAEMIGSIERRTIAGGMLGEPFLSVALGTSCRELGKPYDVFGDHALLGGYYATSDYIRGNAPLLRKFVGAMYRTARWANANRPRSGEILQKYTKISDGVLKTMRRVTYAETLDPSTIQPTLDVAFANKFIDAQLRATDLIHRV